MRPLAPHLVVLFASLASTVAAQTVFPPFNAQWQAVNLGPSAGVNNYSGTAFLATNPNVLLVSPYGSTEIRAVPLTRNVQGIITAVGASTLHATVGGTDGGLAYGPNNVLFHTWYGPNRLGQLLPGSTTANRVDDLAPLGVFQSVGACAFVPAGLPGAGRLKVASWGDSTVYDVPLTPDGTGTYAPGTAGAGVVLSGGPEGMVYAPASTPMFGGRLLVAEWNTGNVSAYQIGATGDPVPGTGQTVLGTTGAIGGGALDPVTGDFVFTSGNQFVVLRNGGVCGSFATYGSASPGASGTPLLSGTGCPRVGNTITLASDHAPGSLGLLALGYYQAAFPYLNLTILMSGDATLAHVTNGNGDWSLNLPIPVAAALGNVHLFFQTVYLDASTSSGLVGSAGLDMLVR